MCKNPDRKCCEDRWGRESGDNPPEEKLSGIAPAVPILLCEIN